MMFILTVGLPADSAWIAQALDWAFEEPPRCWGKPPSRFCERARKLTARDTGDHRRVADWAELGNNRLSGRDLGRK